MLGKKNDIGEFRAAFKNKRIPILTLDERWHELFPEYDKPGNIKALEQRLNNLLKSQGKLVNDIKDMKRLKKKLMSEIIQNMDADTSTANKLNAKKLEKSSELIREINDKLGRNDDELEKVPYQIKEANEELMVQSMKVCYDRLHSNQDEIESLSVWIASVREELKKKILMKQDMEMKNTAIYTYMHDMLGAEMMELFDREQKKKS